MRIRGLKVDGVDLVDLVDRVEVIQGCAGGDGVSGRAATGAMMNVSLSSPDWLVRRVGEQARIER